MSDLPTVSEMALMRKHRIRKTYDEHREEYVYRWSVKCANKRCKSTFCFCADTLEQAISSKLYETIGFRCAWHEPSWKEAARDEWKAEGGGVLRTKDGKMAIPWKKYLDDFIENTGDFESDFGDYRVCECGG